MSDQENMRIQSEYLEELEAKLLSLGAEAEFLASLPHPKGMGDDSLRNLLNLHLLHLDSLVTRSLRFESQLEVSLADIVRTGSDPFFGLLESLFSVCGKICLHVWPSRPQKMKGESADSYSSFRALVERRSSLMQGVLNATEGRYPILSDRAIRNSIAHEDERLDRWYASPDKMHFVGKNVSNTDSMVSVEGRSVVFQYGHFNAKSWVYFYGVDRLEVRALFAELRLLQNSVERARQALQIKSQIDGLYLEQYRKSLEGGSWSVS